MRDIGLYISPAQIPSVWDEVKPFLSKCDGYRMSAEDHYEPLCDGSQNLWLCYHDKQIVGACVTTIVHYPKTSILEVTTLGGCGGNWNEMMEDVEQFAIANQCSRVEIVGRAGWLKALTGYSVVSTIISKEIGESNVS